jgi:hypothetical protein
MFKLFLLLLLITTACAKFLGSIAEGEDRESKETLFRIAMRSLGRTPEGVPSGSSRR